MGGGRDLPHPPSPSVGAHQVSYTIGAGSLSRGVKCGRADNSPLFSAAVMEEYSHTEPVKGKLYLYFHTDKHTYLFKILRHLSTFVVCERGCKVKVKVKVTLEHVTNVQRGIEV